MWMVPTCESGVWQLVTKHSADTRKWNDGADSHVRDSLRGSVTLENPVHKCKLSVYAAHYIRNFRIQYKPKVETWEDDLH